MLNDLPHVFRIELPERLSPANAGALTAKLVAPAESVRVVALVGASDEAFSLGMDLEHIVREGRAPQGAVDEIASALIALHECPRPTLAVVRGRALGGGVGLLAACDYVVADSQASFGLPEALWGFAPAAIWPFLSARMGPARTRAWAVSTVARSAAEASAAGLVDELAAPPELEQRARRVVRQLARIDRDALGLLRGLSMAPAMPITDAVRRGSELTASRLESPQVLSRLTRYFASGELPWESEP